MVTARQLAASVAALLIAGAAAVAGPATVPTEGPFGEWSPAVNGLQARVAGFMGGYAHVIFLELRNSGKEPLKIPALAIGVPNNDFSWHVETWTGGAWKESAWQKWEGMLSVPGLEHLDPHGPREPVLPMAAGAVVLRPGERALIELEGSLSDDARAASRYRVVLRGQKDGPVPDWSGVIETPGAASQVTEQARTAAEGKEAAPSCFPQFDRKPTMLANGSGEESVFLQLEVSNAPLTLQLALYQDSAVAAELDRRLATEPDFTMRLLLAVEAAERGSEAGKSVILDAMKDLDYDHCKSTMDSLRMLAESDHTPAWALDAMVAALQDRRQVKNIPPQWSAGTTFTVSYLADENALLAVRLGEKKYRGAVPVLLKLAAGGEHQRFAIEALGDIGDPAAVPMLLQIVKDQRGQMKIDSGMLEPETYTLALQALVKLKPEAVEDELLGNVVQEDIVAMLEQTGDARAVPVLQQIVASGKAKAIEGSNAESDKSCVEAAKIALATLEPGDPVPRYCALAQDQSLGEFTRREAVWRLGEKKHQDARAIPVLLKAAREDPSGTVVDNAIAVLGAYHDPAAVTGLIDVLGADFKDKRNWKYAFTPEMFRQHVADSLGQITGQSFGTDGAAWKKWWAGQDQRTVK